MCTGPSPCKNYQNFVLRRCPGNTLEICSVGFVDTLYIISFHLSSFYFACVIQHLMLQYAINRWFVGWLVACWLVGLLVCWLVGWLVVGWFVRSFVGSLVSCLVGSLVRWLVVGWLVGWLLVGWLVD